MIEYHYQCGKTIAFIRTQSRLVHFISNLWLKILGFKVCSEYDLKNIEVGK